MKNEVEECKKLTDYIPLLSHCYSIASLNPLNKFCKRAFSGLGGRTCCKLQATAFKRSPKLQGFCSTLLALLLAYSRQNQTTEYVHYRLRWVCQQPISRYSTIVCSIYLYMYCTLPQLYCTLYGPHLKIPLKSSFFLPPEKYIRTLFYPNGLASPFVTIIFALFVCFARNARETL